MRTIAYPAGASRATAFVAVLMITMAFVALSSPAEAARKTSATVSVADGQFATVGMAYVGGDKVEVSITSKEATASNMVRVRAECFQDGQLVYRQYSSVSNGAAALTLGPTPLWQSGDADCTAELGEFDKRMRFRVSASDTFHVTG